MATVEDLPISLPDKTGYVEDISKYDYLNKNINLLPVHHYDKKFTLLYCKVSEGCVNVQVEVESLSCEDVRGDGLAILRICERENYKISFKDLRLLILAKQGVLKIKEEK